MQERRSVELLFLFLVAIVSAAGQGSTLQEVAEAAADAVLPDPAEVAKEAGVPEELVDELQELDDLIEKYHNAEIDFVKWEDVTVKDTEGNPVACPIKVYYDNFEGADFSTGSDGRFSGGISFGKAALTQPICIQVNCDCTTVSVQHTREFGQVNEVLERIKKTIQQKIEEDVGEAFDEMSEPYREELKEQFIKQALANTGAEGFAYATPVLMAFYGAGKAIGETIAWELDNFFSEWFDYIEKFNKGTYERRLVAETGYDCAPGSTKYKKHTPPWFWARWWQEDPYLTDTWNIVVDCKQKDTGPRWVNPDDPDYNPTPPPDPVKGKDDDYIPLPEPVKDAIGKQQEEWINLIEQEREESRKREEQEHQQFLIGVKQRAEQFRKECPICDPIREQIRQWTEEMGKLQQELKAALEKLSQAEATLKQRTLEREAYERDLAAHQNPRSFAASNGRVVTDSDLRIKRWANAQAVDQWRNGELTSQQLHDFWQNYDHGAAVGQFAAALEETVKRAQQAEAGAQETVRQLQQLVQTIQQDIAEAEAAITRLQKDLDECIKKCQERAEQYVRNPPPTPPPTPPGPPSLPTSACRDTPPCCDFYKLISRYGLRTVSDWHEVESNAGYRENLGITDKQMETIESFATKCSQSILPPTTSLPPTTTSLPTYQPPASKSCAETCSSIGMYYPQPDYASSIQAQLSGEVCVSGATITIRKVGKDSCTCYPAAPEVTVDRTKPICRDTFCGDVPCGETRTCQPEPNAAYSATCTWEGWSISGSTAVPRFGVG